ncbi:hypothetical protein HK405_009243, partial [Cladochytrium tenue]
MWNDNTNRICYFVQDEDRLLDYWKTVLGVPDWPRARTSESFLRYLGPYYHLYAFTSSNKTYAYNVIRNLPNTHLLKSVFTRADCEYQGNALIKMPRRVMRWPDGMSCWTREHEVANSLLFDNDPFYAEDAYRDNVVTAKVFKDLKNDDYLLRVLGLLKALAVQNNIQVSLRAWKVDWMAKGIIRKGLEEDFL